VGKQTQNCTRKTTMEVIATGGSRER